MFLTFRRHFGRVLSCVASNNKGTSPATSNVTIDMRRKPQWCDKKVLLSNTTRILDVATAVAESYVCGDACARACVQKWRMLQRETYKSTKLLGLFLCQLFLVCKSFLVGLVKVGKFLLSPLVDTRHMDVGRDKERKAKICLCAIIMQRSEATLFVQTRFKLERERAEIAVFTNFYLPIDAMTFCIIVVQCISFFSPLGWIREMSTTDRR